jgi:hypothetical protein
MEAIFKSRKWKSTALQSEKPIIKIINPISLLTNQQSYTFGSHQQPQQSLFQTQSQRQQQYVQPRYN